jgi:hypothetical protein
MLANDGGWRYSIIWGSLDRPDHVIQLKGDDTMSREEHNIIGTGTLVRQRVTVGEMEIVSIRRDRTDDDC